ncbi:MAG: ice-binding family protein [Casimicrobium sp.]
MNTTVDKYSHRLAKHLGGLLLFASLAVSAQTVPLGTAASFGVIAASAVTSTGPTIVVGDLGVSPGNASSVTGFTFSSPPGPGQVLGTTHFADAVALSAKNDALTAYNTLAARPCTTTISGDLGGRTLTPGVYCSASSMGLTGTLTLDALGNRDAIFIFQLGSALTTASASQVRMTNAGQTCNVFWQIGSSATLGTGSSFSGNILASSSVTLTTGTSNNGRVIALNGAVTLDGSNVAVCSLLANTMAVNKSFNPTTINPNGTSVLTVMLNNPNSVAATTIAPLVDTLPNGVLIANPATASTTCGGGVTPAALAGGNSVTLPTGAIIPANGSCQFSVNVTSASAGTYVNTIPAGALVTSNGINPNPAVATLNVLGANVMAINKSFNPTTINANGISLLTVVLNNPNNSAATLTASLVDNLPSGVLIGNPASASTTCGGGVLPVAVSGGTSVTLPMNATIPANGNCQFSVNVTAGAPGSYVNTIPAGALVTTNGANPGPAIATLNVIGANSMAIGKSFSPTTINQNGVSLLTIVLSNPNATLATLTAPLIDVLPNNVVIANPANPLTTCGGGVIPTAQPGTRPVTLPTGATIPANGSCQVTVNVTSATPGTYLNTIPAGALVTTNGANPSPAIATLTVIALVIPVVSVPTMSTWGLLASIMMLMAAAVFAFRRREAR